MTHLSSSIRWRALAVVALTSIGCAAGDRASAQGQGGGNQGVDLRATLEALADDSLMGRRTGTEGADRAALFIAAELQRHGVQPAFSATPGGDSAYFQRVPLVRGDRMQLLEGWAEYDSVPAEQRVHAANVIGIVPGSDPRLRDEAIVVGAHYDHVGIGRPVDGDSIYNGAGDDASGVVAVLAAARALAAGPPPARTVVFLLTTGEEQGLLGTRWYIRSPVVSLDRTVADLQVEMIGRPDSAAGGPGRAWLTGYERSSLGAELARNGLAVIPDPRPDQQFFLRSDNVAFACQGIPAHTLSSFGLHADYHGPDDEVERIDFAHFAEVVEATIAAVRLLASGDAPAWNEGGDPSRNPTVCG